MYVRNRIALASGFFLFVGMAHAQEYVSSINSNCVVQTFSNGEDRFTNGCGEKVVVAIVFANLKTGSYNLHLDNGAWGTTGHSQARTEALGGAKPHVCPEGSFPVDQEGKPVHRIPVANYRCKKVGPTLIRESSAPEVLPVPLSPLEVQALANLERSTQPTRKQTGYDLEKEAFARSGASSPVAPQNSADLEQQALQSLAKAKEEMEKAQAQMDAQTRSEPTPVEANASTDFTPADATESSTATALHSLSQALSNGMNNSDASQDALRQQLRNIQQQAAALQRKQQAEAARQTQSNTDRSNSSSPINNSTKDSAAYTACEAHVALMVKRGFAYPDNCQQ